MGYMRGGTVLRINLAKGEVTKEPTDRYARLFIGGRGINTKIIYDEVGPKVGALDPENVIAFGTGPFTGTLVPGSSRLEVTAKSPVTGTLGMSSMGGEWAAELKYAGYDHVVITGKASRPVYVAIHNDSVEIRDASHIWGEDTYKTPDVIRKELGEPDAKTICIGLAGENLVNYACISSSKGTAGRTGMGCVMGSKNLKAIAVRGTKGVSFADPDRFLEACLKAHDALRKHPYWDEFTTVGATAEAHHMADSGYCALGNFEANVWNEAPNFTPFWQQHSGKRTGCFGCPMTCKEYFKDVAGMGPLVASCAAYVDPTWGLKQNNPMLWYEFLTRCERYGLDHTQAVGMINWATKLYEEGIITEDDTDGIPMILGSGEAANAMIPKIAKREGFGAILADDTKSAISRIGRGSEKYLLHTRGLTLRHLNYQNWRALGLGHSVSPRGDYTRGGFFEPNGPVGEFDTMPEPEGKLTRAIFKAALSKVGLDMSAYSPQRYEGIGAYVAFTQKVIAVTDMLLHCKWHTGWVWGTLGLEQERKLYSIGTGEDWTIDDLLDVAWRLRSLEMAYDAREGKTRDQDTLPQQLFEVPMRGLWPEDVQDRDKFERAKDEYYEALGWEVTTGVPTRETLERLGLAYAADDLEKLGRLPPTALKGEPKAPSSADETYKREAAGSKRRRQGH